MDTMQLLKYEVIFHWIAVSFYVVSTVLFVYCVVFQKEKSLNVGLWLALIGLIPHSTTLAVRWYAAGHGPYLQTSEILSCNAWITLVMFLIIGYKVPKLRMTGSVVLPFSLLMMAIGLFSNPGIRRLPATFRGVWLIIHIGFAKIAAGSILIGLGMSIFYLLKGKKGGDGFYDRLPSLEILDNYGYRFAGLGFVFWTIAVAAGAIWANQSWGRYWAWDPIETWSLITWLLWGFYLHLRRFYGWWGNRAAWLMIVCFIFSAVTLFVIPFVMTTIHSEYLM